MKTVSICLFLFFSITIVSAQSYQAMTENEATNYENLKASYNAKKIRTRKTQDVYDIKMTIKNSGTDLIKFKNNIGEVEYDFSEYWLAEINFENATGSNLTIMEGHVNAKEFKQRVTYKCGSDDDEIEQSKSMIVGYGLRRGQSVNSTYRIRVPVGDQPVVEIQFVNYD